MIFSENAVSMAASLLFPCRPSQGKYVMVFSDNPVCRTTSLLFSCRPSVDARCRNRGAPRREPGRAWCARGRTSPPPNRAGCATPQGTWWLCWIIIAVDVRSRQEEHEEPHSPRRWLHACVHPQGCRNPTPSPPPPPPPCLSDACSWPRQVVPAGKPRPHQDRQQRNFRQPSQLGEEVEHRLPLPLALDNTNGRCHEV